MAGKGKARTLLWDHDKGLGVAGTGMVRQAVARQGRVFCGTKSSGRDRLAGERNGTARMG